MSPVRLLITLVTVSALTACGGPSEPSGPPTATPTAGGEPYTWPYPVDNPLRILVGRTLDEPIDLFALPAARIEPVAKLAPLDDRARATGNYVKAGEQIWIELKLSEATLWAPVDDLRPVGRSSDQSKRFATLPHDRDLGELGYAIAREYVGSVPDLVVVDLRTDDNPMVIVDATGVEDDAIFGYRIVVTPGLGEAGYTSGKVRITPICARGVTKGACV